MRHTRFFSRRGGESGFTIIELIVVIVILGAVFPLFIALLLNTYSETFRADDKVKMNAQVSQAVWYMEDNVRLASAYLATVPSQFTDVYGPRNAGSSGGEAWSYKGSGATSRVLITQSYATSANALSSSRQPVFINTPSFNCTTQMYYQPQLTFVTIYFVKDGTLYRRVLTDTSTALCAGNTQQQKESCPPYITSGRDAGCQANDEVLATNVSNFTVKYFQTIQAGSDVPIDPGYSSNDPTILSAADYAEVSITTSVKDGDVVNTVTQRMAKVNQ